MSSAFITQIRETCAGQMTPGEQRFCRDVTAATQATLNGHVAMEDFLGALWKDLNEIADRQLDVDAAFERGFQPAVTNLVALGSGSSKRATTEEERAFLHDIIGLVEFACRNGLNFSLVFSILGHDVNEIMQHGGNLERARSQAIFAPKVSGWAKRNAEHVGETPES
jgi:hypothetical protein